MRILKRLALISLILSFPWILHAAEENKAPEDKNKKQEAQPVLTRVAKPKPPIYKPPLRGAPAGRVGGGTRGVTERESFALMVLAPDHIGFTTNKQPCLYWYISKATSYPVEVTLTERYAVSPVLEQVIDGPSEGGIQAICLEDYGVTLEPEINYKWFVTLVTDANQRSKDILAGGMLAMLTTPTSLLEKKKTAPKDEYYFLYAEEGIWYDAVEELQRRIESAPQNGELREQLTDLLAQVGLGEIVPSSTK